jgi:hypothetical protein
MQLADLRYKQIKTSLGKEPVQFVTERMTGFGRKTGCGRRTLAAAANPPSPTPSENPFKLDFSKKQRQNHCRVNPRCFSTACSNEDTPKTRNSEQR